MMAIRDWLTRWAEFLVGPVDDVTVVPLLALVM